MRGMAAEAIDCFQRIKGMIGQITRSTQAISQEFVAKPICGITKNGIFYAAIIKRRNCKPLRCENCFTPFHHAQLPMVAEAHQSTFYQKQRVHKNLQANSQRHRSAAMRNSCKCNIAASKTLMS
jgi:DNA replicative helicase MCM subunit Mcm2 (Cdc46/Mcm family)